MEHSELIDAYYSDELSEDARDAFRERMLTDKEFAAEVAHYRLITEGIRQLADEEDLLEKMNRWDDEGADPVRRTFIFSTPWKIAAVLILLLLASVVLYFSFDFGKPNRQELYAAYFEPYDDLLTNRTVSGSDIDGAMNAYNSGQYVEAIGLFDAVLAGETDPELANIARFYQAISYLSVDEADESEQLLNQVLEGGNPMFAEVSEWYLLLVYIKTERMSAVERQLRLIHSDPDHLYYARAMRLREEM